MFISNAYAQAAGGAAGQNQLLQLLPIVLMFVVLYFLMIRPQMKRAKEHKQMLENVQKGDEVITAGGILGKIIKVGESYLIIEIAKDNGGSIEVNFQKSAVTTVLPKGTIKAI
jgi:preprotein translocase subunit YajC